MNLLKLYLSANLLTYLLAYLLNNLELDFLQFVNLLLENEKK